MALELGPIIGKVGGGGVEEIPVSMSGGGNGKLYPLTTVDAGDGAIILVVGTLDGAWSTSNNRPHLQIGNLTSTGPSETLIGPEGLGIGGRFTGSVTIAILSRYSFDTTFTGVVRVIYV